MARREAQSVLVSAILSDRGGRLAARQSAADFSVAGPRFRLGAVSFFALPRFALLEREREPPRRASEARTPQHVFIALKQARGR